ncbi:transcriptional repressor DicA [uncultured Caudovirales phage]|uniref:Transcriptional repressor DicA n=1 Tax=uncultured Caudovirales phage TaxID=2100421 RepID=A0A6J7WI04_9CAUD|nr:transcriptional repressor DicA [uncultured Caudovirales phage]CAB5217009.1 transcriptional repressor DicA [uncultured Caudovirales phage]
MRSIQAKRLRDLRKKLQLSQKEIGDKLNVSMQVISNWERNYSSPGIESLQDLSLLFDVDIDYLLGLQEIKKKDQPLVMVDPEEQKIIDMYKELSDEGKTWLLNTLKMIK